MKRSTFLKTLGIIAITPKIVSSIEVEPPFKAGDRVYLKDGRDFYILYVSNGKVLAKGLSGTLIDNVYDTPPIDRVEKNAFEITEKNDCSQTLGDFSTIPQRYTGISKRGWKTRDIRIKYEKINNS